MFKKTDKNVDLADTALAEIFAEMEGEDPASDRYTEMVKNVETLLKATDPNRSRTQISKDAVLAVSGNLAGILLILNFERFNVVASKALSFVLKAKL